MNPVRFGLFFCSIRRFPPPRSKILTVPFHGTEVIAVIQSGKTLASVPAEPDEAPPQTEPGSESEKIQCLILKDYGRIFMDERFLNIEHRMGGYSTFESEMECTC